MDCDSGRTRSAWAGARLVAATSSIVIALTFASLALAAGGTSIATAPKIVIGTPEFQNTARDATAKVVSLPGGCGGWRDEEFWRLGLVAGDEVLFKRQGTAPMTSWSVAVFPAGTTDDNVTSAQTVADGYAGQTSLPFTVHRTGNFILAIGPNGCSGGGTDGPYTFSVAVTHKALLYLPPLKTVELSSRVTGFVRTPDQMPITDRRLKFTLSGIWKDASYVPANSHVLATAHPSNGKLYFSFHLPSMLRGTTITLHVTGEASNYQPVSSSVPHVRVS